MARPKSEIRKPEIIQAALKAIGKNGLPMPSYDMIAREAGMSRQLIRHYFPEPEVLMIGVCDALAAAYRESLMKGILRVGPVERLPIFLDFYFNVLAGKGLARPAEDTVYDAMFVLAASSPAIRTTLAQQYNLLQQTIAQEVQINHPQISHAGCREIGFLFVSLIYGHWKMVASLGFSDDYNAVTRQAMDRIIESYRDREGVDR